MRKILVFILFFCFGANIFSQDVKFSDSIDFDVLTVSPGSELYSIFGHSAIRLIDHRKGYDFVFNYGTFDFQTEGFYFKFALGRLDYRLSVESFEDFMQMCEYENRTVLAQKLNLSREQKHTLLFALIENYRPENRYYRYKFFTDNCATRIRDILSQHISGIRWDSLSKVGSGKTFRELYRPYLEQMPWTLTGIELLLGPMADRPAGFDVMFLPDKLYQSLTLAKLGDKPLVNEEKVLFKAEPVPSRSARFNPLYLAIFLLIIALLVQISGTSKRIFANILFTTFGLLGAFILSLSIASAHNELHYNAAVLLFCPFLVVWPWIYKPAYRLLILYISLIFIVIALAVAPFIPQNFNITTYFIVAALVIRYVFNILEIRFGNLNLIHLIKK
ncbi:MAG TPA: DUF4105 domain-containing protein [Bacteroidales bacterium]|nr:DUF4105 domain-containing protein [Bacteroidales bacterium]